MNLLFKPPMGYKTPDSPIITKKKNPWELILDVTAAEGTKKAQTEAPKEQKPKKEEEDPFLAGFNKYDNEEKERLEKFAQIRANADKRAGVAAKVMAEPKKQTDQFLAGFNECDVQPNRENSIQKRMNEVRKNLELVPEIKSPFDHIGYEYMNRDRVYWQEENGKLKQPLGSFSIAPKRTPNVIDIDGKPMMNQLLSLDTKYIDADGVLQESTIPQWVFNRALIKKNNAEAIDKFTKSIVPKLSEKQAAMLTETAEKFKVKNAAKVDVSARKVENFLNTVDEFSTKANINKSIANVAEGVPKILDNGAVKVLKSGGKAASFIGDALVVADLGITAYNDYKDDGSLTKETYKQAAGVVGDLAGSAIGAKIGAWIGGTIGGVASGGVLAAPLAVIGGAVGGLIGGMLSDDLMESVVERYM